MDFLLEVPCRSSLATDNPHTGHRKTALPPPANAPASETKPKEPIIRAAPASEAIYGVGIVGAAPGASVIDDVEMPPEFRDIVGVPHCGGSKAASPRRCWERQTDNFLIARGVESERW